MRYYTGLVAQGHGYSMPYVGKSMIEHFIGGKNGSAGTFDSFYALQERTYRTLAHDFDALQRRDNRNHYNKIVAINRHLAIAEGDRVLEIGIGTGIHAKYLLEFNRNTTFDFYGVDLSEDMLSMAADRLQDGRTIHLLKMPGESLRFDEEYFDKIYISGSLHHFADPLQGIRELLRVLKKGGKFCIMEPNFYFPTNLFSAIFKPEEINLKLMRRKNFQSWFQDCGGTSRFDFEVHNFAYTPPFPKFLIPLYDRLDILFHVIPVLKQCSIMLFVTGQKL